MKSIGVFMISLLGVLILSSCATSQVESPAKKDQLILKVPQELLTPPLELETFVK